MRFPGRRLPFAVEFGSHAAPSPLSVSHLEQGRIVLIGGGRTSDAGAIRQEIAFVERGELWENEDLFSRLVDLNSSGVPFQSHAREMESPDLLMAWWQEAGKLNASFKEISWSSPDQWLITTIDPPVAGVRGWSGPKPFGH
ncbi:hypothetical protein ACQKGL_20215 [Ensifer adhaerens]|uniref:hypothetical protein n=1 Tax=Ensifer adhaerens TaxID=106592 RepID=UPI003D02A59E